MPAVVVAWEYQSEEGLLRGHVWKTKVPLLWKIISGNSSPPGAGPFSNVN